MTEETLITALVTIAGPGLALKVLDMINKRREQKLRSKDARDQADATVEIRLIEDSAQIRIELRDRVVALEDKVAELQTLLTEIKVAHGRLEAEKTALLEDNAELRALNTELRTQVAELKLARQGGGGS